ncbi:hypothetical protein RB195_014223 [Necator americanus]|uniref:Reverse transcriptase domain-containing protein n=1 Tax=Necator americanus TaxID=51031 RepID=A0ABR1DZ48_NECAM
MTIRDAAAFAKESKIRRAGHVMRFNDNRWTTAVSDWVPRDIKRTTGRPPTRWSDFFTKSFKENYDALRVSRERRNHLATLARDRDKWKNYWRLLDQFEDRSVKVIKVMYKVLERIILDRLIERCEEITCDEQADFGPGQSTIGQVFIVKRVIEIWQRYSKPMQLAFLDFGAAFVSPYQGRLLNALGADGVPRKFVRLLDMNQRTTAAVRTPAGCTTPFEVVTGVRQGAVSRSFLFNFAIHDIMRRTVDQGRADIILTPSGHPVTDLEYTDDFAVFAGSSTKLQHVVKLASNLAAAYGLRLRSDRCKKMWISLRPRTGIRVDGQPIELVDKLCYLGCTLKNNGSYKRDVQQECAKATSAFNSLTKCLWSTSITSELKLRIYLSTIRPSMIGDVDSTMNGDAEA